jgi:hypothetical protein
LFVYFILKHNIFNGRLHLFSAQGELTQLRIMGNQGEGSKKGLGKSRGRGEKDRRNPGGELIGDQNPGDGLQLKPFFRGICISMSIWQCISRKFQGRGYVN